MAQHPPPTSTPIFDQLVREFALRGEDHLVADFDLPAEPPPRHPAQHQRQAEPAQPRTGRRHRAE